MSEIEKPAEETFTVWAEADGHTRPLIMTGLNFNRLFDDVVVPYQTDAMFFVDGAPVKAKDLKRIKLLRAKKSLGMAMLNLNVGLTRYCGTWPLIPTVLWRGMCTTPRRKLSD